MGLNSQRTYVVRQQQSANDGVQNKIKEDKREGVEVKLRQANHKTSQNYKIVYGCRKAISVINQSWDMKDEIAL